MQVRVKVQESDTITIGFQQGGASVLENGLPHVACAFARILELKVPLDSVGVLDGGGVRFQCSVWQGGLPVDAVPQQGWLELKTTDVAKLG